MAKKQTRRSISVSRTTYERLKAFCETNNISMSQLVETRVNDFLGPGEIVGSGATPGATVAAPRPMSTAMPPRPMPTAMPARPMDARLVSHAAAPAHGAGPAATSAHPAPAAPAAPSAPSVPMTSAAARFAVEPPPPIIKPRQDTAAPKPAEKRPEQIFTF